MCVLCCVWLFETTLIAAYQTSLSMGFPRQEYWSGIAISFSRESSCKIFSPACKVYHDVNVLHSPCSDLPLILLSLLNYVMSLESNFLDISTALAKFPCWKWPFLPYLDNFFLFFFSFWCGPFLKSLLNLLQYCFCFMFWFFGSKESWDQGPNLQTLHWEAKS